MSNIDEGISFIIPCYNEDESIKDTFLKLEQILKSSSVSYEIIAVDDGSKDNTKNLLKSLNISNMTLIESKNNSGYGASLKKGILKSRFKWIGIIDADGTYPVDAVPDMLKLIKKCDMIVGTRTGKIREIPFLRRPAKWFLNRFASYIAGENIPDVNSGLRLFKKEIAKKYWSLYPQGFSFTTTLTLSMILDNFVIENIPIDYYKRAGSSKISPIADTYKFFLLILRITMLFQPMKIFMPGFLLTGIAFIISLIRDIIHMNITDTSVILFFFSLMIISIGLLADLINTRNKV